MSIHLTLDIDWAPDFAIDFAAEKLIQADVKATWFVTHASPAVDRLRRRPDLFELGIHPNFNPGSSHGGTPEAVLNHCMSLVPEAISMRSHSLLMSSRLLEAVMADTPIRVDTSIFMPHADHIRPFLFHGSNGGKLIRIPYFWEDDYEMRRPEPSWRLDSLINQPGSKVFDFHPIHVFLNGADMAAYAEFLNRLGGSLTKAQPSDAGDLVSRGVGPRTMFEDVIARLARDDGGQHVRSFAAATSLKERE